VRGYDARTDRFELEPCLDELDVRAGVHA
jgi:hypothetical protein